VLRLFVTDDEKFKVSRFCGLDPTRHPLSAATSSACSISATPLIRKTDVTPAILSRDFVARGRELIAKSRRIEHSSCIQKQSFATAKKNLCDTPCRMASHLRLYGAMKLQTLRLSSCTNKHGLCETFPVLHRHSSSIEKLCHIWPSRSSWIGYTLSFCKTSIPELVAWHSGRTSVSDWRTFPVLRSTCS